MGIARKLKEAGQTLEVVTTRNDLAHFLSNPKNAQGVNSLVEDIRYAMMDYQVCTQMGLSLIMPDTFLRLHYNKTSTTRAVKRL